MKIQIKNRWDNSIIFEDESESLLLAIEEAVCKGIRLYGANLHGASLHGASLHGANLDGANLGDPGSLTIGWNIHALLSEILWRAARDSEPRQMLAAYVGRRTGWCWKQWGNWEHPEKEWALRELAKWAKDGDDAPEIVRAFATKTIKAQP